MHESIDGGCAHGILGRVGVGNGPIPTGHESFKIAVDSLLWVFLGGFMITTQNPSSVLTLRYTKRYN